ncbi:hypothetical protein IE077_003159 [Cardiosporidium cionae]|uniref:Uncharacterized protein n=1 Tax=Cardiosporidium cionae TaxID=476202 RepID=A0ABQ7J921_9APIC|nr:hypothetical protein IE077_003159 [Cardiosporidium cionae]|eukprot:KAF8820458.1 hypothetical protein IE077_003159 [Cardiosporidium cionae]
MEMAKTSVLQHVQKELEERGQNSRICILIQLHSDQSKDERNEKLFDIIEELQDISKISGIILYISFYLLFFLESTTENIFEILTILATTVGDVAADTAQEKRSKQLRVLHFSDLNYGKILPHLLILQCSSWRVNIPANQTLMVDQQQEAQELLKKAENFDYIPSPEALAIFFSDNEAIKHTWSYADFQEFFMSPFKLKLDSEIAWPVSDIVNIE